MRLQADWPYTPILLVVVPRVHPTAALRRPRVKREMSNYGVKRLQALGWQPETDFDTALARTPDWYRTNEDWWRPLQDADATTRRGRTP